MENFMTIYARFKPVVSFTLAQGVKKELEVVADNANRMFIIISTLFTIDLIH